MKANKPIYNEIKEDELLPQEETSGKFISSPKIITRSISKREIYTAFESLDGWGQYVTGSGTTNTTLGEMVLDTGVTINSIADRHCEVFLEGDAINFFKNPYFETAIRLSNSTNQIIYVANGAYDTDCFGFKILNGVLYALHVKNGTEYTNGITAVTLTDWNVYKATYVSGNCIKFYINDILKVTISENMPIATDSLERFRYYIKNIAAERKYLFSQYLLLNQDL